MVLVMRCDNHNIQSYMLWFVSVTLKHKTPNLGTLNLKSLKGCFNEREVFPTKQQ